MVARVHWAVNSQAVWAHKTVVAQRERLVFLSVLMEPNWTLELEARVTSSAVYERRDGRGGFVADSEVKDHEMVAFIFHLAAWKPPSPLAASTPRADDAMWSVDNKTIDFSGLEPELKAKFVRFVDDMVGLEEVENEAFTLTEAMLEYAGRCDLNLLDGESCILNLLFKRVCDILVPGHTMSLKVCESFYYNKDRYPEDMVMYVAFDEPRTLNPRAPIRLPSSMV
jgi:hypothetical protein